MKAATFLFLMAYAAIAATSPMVDDGIFYSGFEPASNATGTLTTDSPCSLPGASDPNQCTTHGTWYAKDSPVTCIWVTNPYQVVGCEGLTEGVFEWPFTTVSGTQFELRSHAIFPNSDPQWPNPTGIVARSKLLDTRQYKAVAACTITVPAGGDIGGAITGTSGVRTICLSAGAYALTAGISIPSDLTVRGLGATPQDTVLSASSGLVGNLLQLVEGAHDVTLENFKAVSNGALQSGIDSVGVGMVGVKDVAVRKLDVSNTYRMNIAVVASSNITVSDTSFSQMGFQPQAVGAIYMSQSDNIVFERNTVVGRNNGPGEDGGVDCYASSDVVIRNNSITNAGESAIYSTFDAADPPSSPACKNVIISDNTIDHSQEWGIDMRGLDGALIRRNHVTNCNFPAMSIWDSANSRVIDNVMNNNNQLPLTGHCQGINRQGTQANMIYTGNSGNGTLLCTF